MKESIKTPALQSAIGSTYIYVSLTKVANLMKASLLPGGEQLTVGEIPGKVFREIVGETMPPLSKGRKKSEFYPVLRLRKNSLHVRYLREKNQRGEIYIGYGDFLEWLITKPAFNLLTVYLLGYGPGNSMFDDSELPDAAVQIFKAIHSARKGILLSYSSVVDEWSVHEDIPSVNMNESISEDESKTLLGRMLNLKSDHFRIASEFFLIRNESVLKSSVAFKDAMMEKGPGTYHPSDFAELDNLEGEMDTYRCVACKKAVSDEDEVTYTFLWTRGQLLHFVTGYYSILPRSNLSVEFFGERMVEDIVHGECENLLPDESNYLYKERKVFPATSG